MSNPNVKNICQEKFSLILCGLLVGFWAGQAALAREPSSDVEAANDQASDAQYRLKPLPATYTVVEHFGAGSDRGGSRAGWPTEKIVYANTLGTYLFQPGAGNRVADDLVTTLAAPCTLNEFTIRVSGGVEGGGGEFKAEVVLYDGCPDVNADGVPIRGTLTLFTELDDDSAVFHDLVLDYRDRGICDDESPCLVSAQDCADASACVANPLVIPREIWVRIRFDTSDAGIVAGAPPEIGFSADGYDDVFGDCRNDFGGWPDSPHASFWATVIVPEECSGHFLAYLAGGGPPQEPTPVPFPVPPTSTLADDITLSVPTCTLDSYEVFSKGTSGQYEVTFDLRGPDLDTVIPETEGYFVGRGESGSLEIAHVSIPHDVNIEISESDQPIYFSWTVSRIGASVPYAGGTLAGSSDPFLYARLSEGWTPVPTPAYPTVANVAIYCRGEPPTGACCSDIDEPGANGEVCIDGVPVTDCLGHAWSYGEVCGDDPSNWPCGSRACCLPDGTCEDLFESECTFACDPSHLAFHCTSDGDCPDGRRCFREDYYGGVCGPLCGVRQPDVFCDDPSVDCHPACGLDDLVSAQFEGGWVCYGGSCYLSEGAGPNCAIDARQPHSAYNSNILLGWDRLVLIFECDKAALRRDSLDFVVRSAGGKETTRAVPIQASGGNYQVVVEFDDPIPPGEWTCVQHEASGREWCAGFLPGDVNQDRLVSAGDVLALIDSINLVPGRDLPPYATDIDRSNETNASDILRLIDLLNGAGDFDAWLSRSLPLCPTAP